MNIIFESLKPSAVTELFEYALQFYGRKLGLGNVTLRVVTLDDMFLDTMTGEPAEEGEPIVGAVYNDAPEYDTQGQTTYKFGFWYGSNPGQLFQVMAHEMVHVQQYSSGRLRTVRDANGVANYWNGKLISGETYDGYPWEIEAYMKQDGLLDDLIGDDEFMSMVREMGST